MCVVSNIGEMGKEMWPKPGWPTFKPWVAGGYQTIPAVTPPPYNGPTKAQFEKFLELMRAARKFDKATGQVDCPTEDKTAWMRELARLVGVDPKKVDEILKGK